MPTWFRKKPPTDEVPVQVLPPDDGGGEVKSFFEHLDDLRAVLFRMVGALFVGFNLCLIFANRIWGWLKWPLAVTVPDPQRYLQVIEITDSFMLIMKIALYGGLLVTAPVLAYFVAKFVLPALTARERRMVMPVCVFGTLLFVLGACTCFFWLLPATLKAFVKYGEWMQLEVHWTAMSYVEFVTQFMLYMGLAFELPLVLLILVQLGILSAESLQKGRRICIVVAAVIAAFVAPPDFMGMILMMLPLMVLFEITIWVAWFMERRKRKV